MLKELILSILLATPLGLALLIGVIYFIVLVIREIRMWRQARRTEVSDEDLPEIEGEEVVYGYY
jgi:uncharacterized membrane protein